MLCNFQHFLMNSYKSYKDKGNDKDNDRKTFEFEKIKPLYIPPYQYIPIYNTCTYKIDQGTQSSVIEFATTPIISQKLYNAIKYSSIITNEEYKRPLPVKIKMYI